MMQLSTPPLVTSSRAPLFFMLTCILFGQIYCSTCSASYSGLFTRFTILHEGKPCRPRMKLHILVGSLQIHYPNLNDLGFVAERSDAHCLDLILCAMRPIYVCIYLSMVSVTLRNAIMTYHAWNTI